MSEVGARLRQTRLNQGISQADLASQAGISELTLRKMEAGSLGQTRNLLRVLRGLGLLDNLESAIPSAVASPVAESDNAGRARQRSPRNRPATDRGGWVWGEDQ
jgi:transcriptional regulator with XRE-family HTH domain